MSKSGVVNGIDYTEWHPASDPHLRRDGYANYDVNTLTEGKARCKAALQKVGWAAKGEVYLELEPCCHPALQLFTLPEGCTSKFLPTLDQSTLFGAVTSSAASPCLRIAWQEAACEAGCQPWRPFAALR